MTDKEWQKLCRETKNNGTYPQLINAIKMYSKYDHIVEERRFKLNPKDIIRNNRKITIEMWYINYINKFNQHLI